MKALMIMFDSLNRHMLPPYGGDWIKAPNFQRLAERAVTFDCSYVGSMPCMPARRELHTGRYNFLHRSWGPVEPYDESMPELLKNAGIYSHLISDHYHYWEDGGATYHTRYSSWEISRGQEGDPWKGMVADPVIPETLNNSRGLWRRQDWVNRQYMQTEQDQSQAQTFSLAAEFLEQNAAADNWFLHVETFDPHEPWYTQEHYKDLYPHKYDGPHFDWPNYTPVQETPEQVEHLRCQYAALVSMCDHYLGRILDIMDANDLWQDTMLIVNTDHGFLLGEHGWWAKCKMPFYNEVAHTPLFIWDPRSGQQGKRRQSLVQTIDLAPTLLDFFGLRVPKTMQGRALAQTIADDTPVRSGGLFGIFGGQVNYTDGRYVYMRSPVEQNQPLFQYTLMPTRHGAGRAFIELEELRTVQLAEPFSFTKNCPLMQLESRAHAEKFPYPTVLYDLHSDPKQEHPIVDATLEETMVKQLTRLMAESDAPREQYERLGLRAPAKITATKNN